jgi:hypothetical protein
VLILNKARVNLMSARPQAAGAKLHVDLTAKSS